MIVNLTPHPVVVLNEDDSVLRVFHPEGLARVSKTDETKGFIEDDGIQIPTSSFKWGDVEGLPDWVPFGDTFYIVSGLVRTAETKRDDLLQPVDLVRDSDGNIIGCRALGIS